MSDRPTWAAALLAAGLLVWSPRAAVALRRLDALRAQHRAPPPAPTSPPHRARPVAWSLVSGSAVWLLLGGGTGLVAGVVAAGLVHRLTGRPDPGGSALAAARSRELPGACDLLAVTLAAGLSVGDALASVGSVTPSPLGGELEQIAALYRLGAEPRRAWAQATPELAVLGRTLVRAGESGSSVGVALRSLAAEIRAAERAAAHTALQRAGVWVLAPLGLCFLPAFVCLGVAPLVLGLAAGALG